MPKERNERVIVVDPRMMHDRMLSYNERHQGWHIFESVYWATYLVVLGIMLVYYDALGLTVTLFLGAALLILALMLVLYGLTKALHHKFMKKYG